ncbi:hypothetical protein [Novosphingobium clariflavum]|uniref:Uncharacterized protein n=1 Tax=Novosphingobium clariflavum TaxID=2029884 RepID=A0ABV6S5Z9_9SPHN|nr:hypothetical protein [Novosphingobium clariflavum]
MARDVLHGVAVRFGDCRVEADDLGGVGRSDRLAQLITLGPGALKGCHDFGHVAGAGRDRAD